MEQTKVMDIVEAIRKMSTLSTYDYLPVCKYEYEVLKKYCEELSNKKIDKLTHFYGKRILLVEMGVNMEQTEKMDKLDEIKQWMDTIHHVLIRKLQRKEDKYPQLTHSDAKKIDWLISEYEDAMKEIERLREENERFLKANIEVAHMNADYLIKIEQLEKENEIMWNALDDIASISLGMSDCEYAKQTIVKVEALREE